MNCKKIIKAKLKELGADGLCTEDCGCGLDDLFPCDECQNILDCVPAKKIKCDGLYIFVSIESCGDESIKTEKNIPVGEYKKCLKCGFRPEIFRNVYNYCPYCGVKFTFLKDNEIAGGKLNEPEKIPSNGEQND